MAKDLPSIPLYATPVILVYKKSIPGMKKNPASAWSDVGHRGLEVDLLGRAKAGR